MFHESHEVGSVIAPQINEPNPEREHHEQRHQRRLQREEAEGQLVPPRPRVGRGREAPARPHDEADEQHAPCQARSHCAQRRRREGP